MLPLRKQQYCEFADQSLLQTEKTESAIGKCRRKQTTEEGKVAAFHISKHTEYELNSVKFIINSNLPISKAKQVQGDL